MTNLVATIAVVVSTNWMTVSTTTVPPGYENYTVRPYSTDNQIGWRVTNLVALVEWKGAFRAITLETKSGTPDLALRREVVHAATNFNHFNIRNE
jgi:hypothetical protein